MLVVNQLAGSGTSGSNTQTKNHIVKSALKVLQQNLTSNATGTRSLLEHVAELLLQNTIGVLCLLLLSQHDTILRCLAATVVTMLPRRELSIRKNLVSTENSFAETAGNP